MWRAAQFWTALIGLLSGLGLVSSAQTIELKNANAKAELGTRGLISVTDIASGSSVALAADEWSITLNGRTLRSEEAKPIARKSAENQVVYEYDLTPYRIQVIYTISPGWTFVSKQVQVAVAPAPGFIAPDY
jgi:hypothetical protein